MEYKKKSLSNLDIKRDYEEIDTRLASGWYVDDINTPKKKIYKTCLLYTSPSPRDATTSRMPSSA